MVSMIAVQLATLLEGEGVATRIGPEHARLAVRPRLGQLCRSVPFCNIDRMCRVRRVFSDDIESLRGFITRATT
jgi:hypothetical protein